MSTSRWSRKAWQHLGALGLAIGCMRCPSVMAAPRPLVERPFSVVLDPGHGGDNLGCLSADEQTREKAYTLALARSLRTRLEQLAPHIRVVMTRESDISLPLHERVTMANELGADLLISLHANASPTQTQSGYETYVLDPQREASTIPYLAGDPRDELLAEPGHRSVPEAMLAELKLAAAYRRAGVAADGFQREHARAFPKRLDRGVKSAPFDVLTGARMPAVLHEVGFLDHPEEGPWLLDRNASAQMVDTLAAAILAYYRWQAF